MVLAGTGVHGRRYHGVPPKVIWFCLLISLFGTSAVKRPAYRWGMVAWCYPTRFLLLPHCFIDSLAALFCLDERSGGSFKEEA